MSPPLSPRLNHPLVATLVAAAILSGCAAGNYVWVDDYRGPGAPLEAGRDYVISAGDVISVRVFNQEQMSAKERVRPDGKVSLPFLNDVIAVGFTPKALAAQLQTRLKDFINTPVVTVTVDEPRGVTVAVAGEVAKPGVFSLEPGVGVLQALVVAGGLTEYGGRDRIYVLRSQGRSVPPLRVRFRYWELVRGEGQAPFFQLKPGDTVIVE